MRALQALDQSCNFTLPQWSVGEHRSNPVVSDPPDMKLVVYTLSETDGSDGRLPKLLATMQADNENAPEKPIASEVVNRRNAESRRGSQRQKA